MEIKLDTTICYAIALEGGGAKGGYEIGVWKALDEAGIRYNAVSGTSVGALNGALYAIGDLPRAIDYWATMNMDRVFDLSEEDKLEFQKILAGNANVRDLREFAPEVLDVLKNKGLDASPLRNWMNKVMDERSFQQLRRNDIDFYVTTVNLSDRKGQIVHINEIPDDQVVNMLLASAYHPSFKLEKLGDKLYTDGGFIDSLPIYPLVKAGYKNIIAVHIPGIGRSRRFKMPDDVTVHHIVPRADLGGSLNFDSKQSLEDMTWGYMDAKRLIYGLTGRYYYIDPTLSERQALDILLDYYQKEGYSMREAAERRIPALSIKSGLISGTYPQLLTALAEHQARKKQINPFRVYTDKEFCTIALN